MLKIKQIFYILTLICLTGFFILPNIALANDLENIDLKEYGKYLELPSRNVESLLHSLINLFYSEWINLMASSHSSAEELAVPSIMKKVVQVQALNHLLIDAPIEITWAIIKNGTNVAKIFLTKDPSAILKEFEKQSVKKAVAFGMSVLLEGEIKITPGAMDFQYISQKQEKKIASFQYIIAYKPVNFEKGEVLIRFYSPKPLEPPINKGSIGLKLGIYTDITHDLSPFIVDIHGFLKDYKWASNPSIKITFPDQVPDLGIRPLTWWQKYVLKPITSTIKNVEVIVTKITGISLGLTDAWHSIKSLVSGIFDFISPAGIATSFPSTETIEKEQRQEQESLFFSNLNSDQDKKQESSEEKTLSLEKNIPLTESDPVPSLDDLQKTLNEIAKQIEMLAQKLNEFEAENEDKELKETETCSVNINTASQQELEKLTGIGPVLAQRIIEARPFNSIYELINVKGIGDSVLGKIINQACSYVAEKDKKLELEKEEQTEKTTQNVCPVNINTASKKHLEAIIGIGPVLAERIMLARPFSSVNDLIRVNGIGQVTLEKIINQNCAYVTTSGGSSPNPSPSPSPSPEIGQEIGTLDVVINEIAWMGTKAGSTHEWIELYNNTDSIIDLTGWKIESTDQTLLINFSTSTIQNKDYFLLERTDDNRVSDVNADLIYTGILKNNPNCEILSLYDKNNNLIDQTVCHDNGNWPAGEASPNYITMERIDSTLAGSDLDNWANNNLITRNGLDRDGEPINGTPRQENSVSKSETEIIKANIDQLFEEFNEITFTYHGSPYITSGLRVPEDKTLKVEPGVVLQFREAYSRYEIGTLIIEGTLLATSSEEKIVFTSIYDEDYGIEAALGNPEEKRWRGFRIHPISQNSELENVLVRYAGAVFDQGYSGGIWVEGSSIKLKNSIIENSNTGLYLKDSDSQIENLTIKDSGPSYGAVEIFGGSPVIKNSFFKNGSSGMVIKGGSRAEIIGNHFEEIQYIQGAILVKNSASIFKDNSGKNNALNGIYLLGSISEDWHLFQNDENFPYIIGQLNILASTTLTIDAGLIIKFIEFGKISVNGTLKAIGQEDKKIIFTSAADEQYGGKTDNAFIGPDIYHWDQIYFSPSSENSILEHAVFRYAANPHTLGFHFSDGAVCLENSPTTQIMDCHFENMEKGIRIEGNCPRIERVSFSNVDCLYNRGTVCYDFYDEICLI